MSKFGVIPKPGAFQPGEGSGAEWHAPMLDTTTLESVAAQLMTAKQVELQGQTWPVTRTSSQRLRTARFTLNGREYQAIEQNRHKPSRWGQLAREGHQVVQFRDIETGKYVAVAVDGKVQEYGRG